MVLMNVSGSYECQCNDINGFYTNDNVMNFILMELLR